MRFRQTFFALMAGRRVGSNQGPLALERLSKSLKTRGRHSQAHTHHGHEASIFA